jgi:hypothetical protein
MLEAKTLQLEAELVTVRTRHLINHRKLYTRLPVFLNVGQSTLIVLNSQIKKEEIMQPTAWDFRNQLMAVLNGARQSGEPHIDAFSDPIRPRFRADSGHLFRCKPATVPEHSGHRPLRVA